MIASPYLITHDFSPPDNCPLSAFPLFTSPFCLWLLSDFPIPESILPHLNLHNSLFSGPPPKFFPLLFLQRLGNLTPSSFSSSVSPMSLSPCDYILPLLHVSPRLSIPPTLHHFPLLLPVSSHPSHGPFFRVSGSPLLRWVGGREGGGNRIVVAGGSLGRDWFLISTMAMMMQEPNCHLIPCPPTPSSGLLSPPAQPICWRLGTCLGLPRWELAPPRPWGWGEEGELGEEL